MVLAGVIALQAQQQELDHAVFLQVLRHHFCGLGAAATAGAVNRRQRGKHGVVGGRVGHRSDIRNHQGIDPVGGIEGQLHGNLAAQRVADKMRHFQIAMLHPALHRIRQIRQRHALGPGRAAVVGEVETVYPIVALQCA